MASLDDMQSSALNDSEKEDSKNNIANANDDEMPAVIHAEYVAELKQQTADILQRQKQQITDYDDMPAMTNAEYISELKQRYANMQEQHYHRIYLAMILGFSAFVVVCILNAKKDITTFTIQYESPGYEFMNSNEFMVDGEFALLDTQV